MSRCRRFKEAFVGFLGAGIVDLARFFLEGTVAFGTAFPESVDKSLGFFVAGSVIMSSSFSIVNAPAQFARRSVLVSVCVRVRVVVALWGDLLSI